MVSCYMNGAIRVRGCKYIRSQNIFDKYGNVHYEMSFDTVHSNGRFVLLCIFSERLYIQTTKEKFTYFHL